MVFLSSGPGVIVDRVPYEECFWSNYSELTVSSLLKYEVVISEQVGFSAHGRPERGESAGKTHDPGAAGPRGTAGASWVL